MNNCSKCIKCGKCCSNYLPLSKAEITHLKNIIKERKLKPTKTLYPDWYDWCPFLNNTNMLCNIYEYRPMICRAFTCKYDNKQSIDSVNSLLKVPRCLVNLRSDLFHDKNKPKL